MVASTGCALAGAASSCTFTLFCCCGVSCVSWARAICTVPAIMSGTANHQIRFAHSRSETPRTVATIGRDDPAQTMA